MKKIIFLWVMALSCSISYAQITYETKTNIPYREGSSDAYVDDMCKLDIYYPIGIKNPPVIVWFHGGGLSGGGKEIPNELKNQGFAIVGVGYRLTPHVKTDQCIDDAAAAVAWTYKNIDKYVDGLTDIYVAGHSAGAYLTLMVGLDKQLLGKYDVDADLLTGLIPYSAQVITHFATRNERGIRDTQAIIDNYAPLYHVRADAPPIVIITGDREMELLGRYEENAYFWRMLQLVGHKSATLYELDGFDHGNMAAPAHLIAIRYIKNRTAK